MAKKSKAVKARAAGTKLFNVAGRPTKAQFIKVFGKRGPAMTWTERAATGVSAEQFQQVLAEKSKR